MKIGINLKIDVTKIDKSKLYKGQKGTYLDATAFIDLDNPGQYGDHGFISQSVSKEEKEAGVKGAILGNVKVFWQENAANDQYQAPAQQQPQQQAQAQQAYDDIPF